MDREITRRLEIKTFYHYEHFDIYYTDYSDTPITLWCHKQPLGQQRILL